MQQQQLLNEMRGTLYNDKHKQRHPVSIIKCDKGKGRGERECDEWGSLS
jgi:hypothetical protein